MTDAISAVSSTGATSKTGSTSSISSTTPLTAETKAQLQALGVDTTGITTEAQGQTALLQAQLQQAQQGQQGKKAHGGGNKAEMEALKSQALSLASKLGVSVSSDAKLDDIVSAIGPAIEAKMSAAGNDPAKLAEIQELQSEYNELSSAMSNMQAQHSQQQASQSQLTNSMDALARYNKVSL